MNTELKIIIPEDLEQGTFFREKHSNIIEAIKEPFCLFLGAGISKLIGHKLWKELAKSMVNRFRTEGLLAYSQSEYLKSIADKNPIDVMDYLSFCADQNSKNFNEIIDKEFELDGQGHYEVLDALKPLLELDECVVVQTNIDTELEEYFKNDIYNIPTGNMTCPYNCYHFLC